LKLKILFYQITCSALWQKKLRQKEKEEQKGLVSAGTLLKAHGIDSNSETGKQLGGYLRNIPADKQAEALYTIHDIMQSQGRNLFENPVNEQKQSQKIVNPLSTQDAMDEVANEDSSVSPLKQSGNVDGKVQVNGNKNSQQQENEPKRVEYGGEIPWSKEGKERYKIEQKTKADADTFQKDFINDVVKQGRAADKDIETIDLLTSMAKSGKLPSNWAVSAANLVGMPVSLFNTTGAEYEKVLNQFLPQMQSIFGSQIRVSEMAQFMKGLPGLLMTDEGKVRVLQMMRTAAVNKKATYDAYDQFLHKNGNKAIPKNLAKIVDYKAQGQIEKNNKKMYRELGFPDIETPRKLIKGNPQDDATFKQLVEKFGSPQAAADALQEMGFY
jgi:hypothetical protein